MRRSVIGRLQIALIGIGALLPTTLLANPAAAAPPCSGRVPTIIGTPGADEITGTPGDDVIRAGAGGDVVRGAGGNDVICGGVGNDRLSGGPGHDEVYGAAGADELSGGSGRDRLESRLGADIILRGGAAHDLLIGGDGDRMLLGGGAHDVVDVVLNGRLPRLIDGGAGRRLPQLDRPPRRGPEPHDGPPQCSRSRAWNGSVDLGRLRRIWFRHDRWNVGSERPGGQSGSGQALRPERQRPAGGKPGERPARWRPRGRLPDRWRGHRRLHQWRADTEVRTQAVVAEAVDGRPR